MTADEIRKLERDRYGYEDGTKTALFEIAAQLAKLNAILATLLEPKVVYRLKPEQTKE